MKEIAEVQHITIGCAKSQYWHAKQNLHRMVLSA
jgi:hypothetical protein